MTEKEKSVGPASRRLTVNPAVVLNVNSIGQLPMIRSSRGYSQGDGLTDVKEF